MRFHRFLLAASLLLATYAAGCSGGGEGSGGVPDPRPGATNFVSADDSRGRSSQDPSLGGDFDGAPPSRDEGEGGGDDRTVEEGDVYRTFGQDLLLNLNAWRGLQVIDLSRLDRPRVLARLEMSGTPVELYVSGTRAYVLMNAWRGYWGSRDDVAVETFEGGVILSVDLSEPASPRVIDTQPVPGWIYKSRLVRGGGQESLYVVSQRYDYSGGTYQTSTRATSFQVGSDGTLAAMTELDLGGWIADIAATPEALLVARYDWRNGTDRSLVSLVDISSPDGTMIEGAEIRVEGLVKNQFNLDLHRGVLRVVSGRTWGNRSNTNHLETFDASDIHRLTRIDHQTFGDNEDLYATLFLGNSAFFVTYERVDPFHAFHIGDDGRATEMSEFIVSGWNDFFRPVFSDSRLVGIGVNDERGRTMAVSLYDITDLSNPHPLITRAEVAASNSWSEASWDHRAFSVLENAVHVRADDGTVETGLVLLPFSGWDAGSGRYTAAVQIFTFSETTLTRRGLMDHGSPVNRSFRPAPATAANLSQQELSLFDMGDPDEPREIGRLDLAPNYPAVLPFGDHVVRLKEPDDWYRWAWGSHLPPRPAEVQIVARSEHPDNAAPVAQFEVPSGSTLYRVGNHLLAAVRATPADTSQWPYTWETTVQVYDLSDPARPRARGTLVTDRLAPDLGYGYGYGYGDWNRPEGDCFDCGWWGGTPALPVHVVGDALAFVERLPEQENLGTERVCQSWPRDRGSCGYGQGAEDCTFVTGYQTCTTRAGTTACHGSFSRCTWSAEDGTYACEEIDGATVDLERSCRDQEAWRHWSRFRVQVVDLSRPDAPTLGTALDSPRTEEAVSALVEGSSLWLSHKEPHRVAGDNRPYVRHFSRRIDLRTPARPAAGTAVNLPGELLAVEGATLYTRDRVWGDRQVESAVARLQLERGVAVLEAHRRFEGRHVQTVALDGAGHVLVSHMPGWYGAGGWYGGNQPEALQRLTLLDASSSSLAELASTPVDSWATLKDARAGRALFQVPGGLLVFNLDRPASPVPQAFFSTKGWPSEILVDGREILFAAGRYGIYRFDLDSTNLQRR